MIGVLAEPSEARAVEEFFELFKTPWEFYDPLNSYDCVIASKRQIPQRLNADALVIYQSHSTRIGIQTNLSSDIQPSPTWVKWQDTEFPVYGDCGTLPLTNVPWLTKQTTGETVGSVSVSGGVPPTARIAIDLFKEVAYLLSQGQPPENAYRPTLDIHIAVLRSVLSELGVIFAEVLSAPAGYDFAACITHDVDFVRLTDHKCDHTMWGFLYRGSVASSRRALSGELSWSKCFRNWAAVATLPLVHLGLRDDPWVEFQRYATIEKSLGSTYFFIPFSRHAGTVGKAAAPKRRAAKYDLSQLKAEILQLSDSGCEIGVHGIDAWQSTEKGKAELQQIGDITGVQPAGTRMHWLYWSDESPRLLEEAGFQYDSTFGYNAAIGFRAGTAQVFRPLGADRLLELPLIIQDSAMFYSDRMKLSEPDALNACKVLLRSLRVYGGALTINWHTRSLSPERMWGDFYIELLKEVNRFRVWFGTAEKVTTWFRKRRSLRLREVRLNESGTKQLALTIASGTPELPFVVRIHRSNPIASSPSYADHVSTGNDVLELPTSSHPVQIQVPEDRSAVTLHYLGNSFGR